MKFLCSIFTAAALAWVICCMRWVCTDAGIVRFNSDATYLLLAMAGIVWLVIMLWCLLHPNLWK